MNSVQIFFKTYTCSQFRLDHLPEKTTPLYSSLHKPYELKKKSKILNQPIDRVHWLMHQGDVTLWIWLCWLLRISHCFSPISQYFKVFIFLPYMPGGFTTTIPLFCYLSIVNVQTILTYSARKQYLMWQLRTNYFNYVRTPGNSTLDVSKQWRPVLCPRQDICLVHNRHRSWTDIP
jgi:hypothetical protein